MHETTWTPGVYDMPDHEYHDDPVPGGSLSSSGARKLLPPYCPARFHYERDNPPESSPEFEFGKAAHRVVLGAGPDVAVVNAEDWHRVNEMAGALARHPVAGKLFNPACGKAEQSLFWVDDRSGVWRRARLDWLPDPGTGRLVLVDYKTCGSASPESLQRAVYNYGYHQQASWYLDGARALGMDQHPVFLFVFQEKTAPYLVTVVQPDTDMLRVGARRNIQALDLYRECTATGRWPGYSDEIELVSLPAWVETREPVGVAW